MTATAATRTAILDACHAEGFDPVRVAPAAVIPASREAALDAAASGRLEGLHWMDRAWLDRATDAGVFLPGAKSVVLVAMPYRPAAPIEEAGGPSRGRIAAYAAGRDYHRLFEPRLRRVARFIRDEFGAGARATVDYGPLLERPLAARAGVGWQGKSTMLLVPGAGPWVMLGAIATTLELEPDRPLRKTCGSCTRCIEACPTGAIDTEGRVDARLCISYHTIENRGPIPRELRERFGNWVFGCDDCLDVCPPGFKHDRSHPDLEAASLEGVRPELAPLLSLTPEAFAERFRGRAIMRAKRDGLLRNVCVAFGNVGTEADVPSLAAALHDDSALVRGHAAWALGRIALRCGEARETVTEALGGRLEAERDGWCREEMEMALAALRS